MGHWGSFKYKSLPAIEGAPAAASKIPNLKAFQKKGPLQTGGLPAGKKPMKSLTIGTKGEVKGNGSEKGKPMKAKNSQGAAKGLDKPVKSDPSSKAEGSKKGRKPSLLSRIVGVDR